MLLALGADGHAPKRVGTCFLSASLHFKRFYATGWEADFGLVMWRASNVAFIRTMAVVPSRSGTTGLYRSRCLNSPASGGEASSSSFIVSTLLVAPAGHHTLIVK